MNQCDSDPFHLWLRTCVWCNDWPSTSYLLGACLVFEKFNLPNFAENIVAQQQTVDSPVCRCLSRLFVTAGICILCVCDSINMKSLFIATFSIAKICKTNTAATNPNNPSPKIHPRRPTLPQRKCQLSVKRNTKLEMKGGWERGSAALALWCSRSALLISEAQIKAAPLSSAHWLL